MKIALTRIVASALLCIGAQDIYAATYAVTNVSNMVVSCSNPMLKFFKPGSCLSIPSNTVALTATLSVGESPSTLNDLNVTLQHNNATYQYDGTNAGHGLHRWHLTSSVMTSDPVAPSFVKAPFESASMTRFIDLGDVVGMSGAKIYVTAKAATSTTFAAVAPQLVYTVP